MLGEIMTTKAAYLLLMKVIILKRVKYVISML
jgi:hypothetical protein